MDLKIILGIISIAVAVIVATILLPGGPQVDKDPKLPWLITIDESGRNSVFGITLGQSTLQDAEQAFKLDAKLSLFKSPDGTYDVEAYFDRIYLSGLKASIVVKLLVDQNEAKDFFEHGARISQMGSGTKKIDLSSEAKAHLANDKIDLITYLPGTDLEPELIEKHFGKPAETLADGEMITHWLYPEKGLDIAVNADGKEVFQYVLPAQFERVTSALQPVISE